MNRRGMTLIELTVGLVITGIATAAGYVAFSSIIDSRERSRASTLEVHRAASMRALLSSWFANSRIVRDSGTVLPASFGLGGVEPNDDITIVTGGPTPLGAQQTQIRLYIDHDDFTPERGLVAEFTALNQPIDSTLMMVVARKMELDPLVQGLEVTLLDPTTRLWVTKYELGTTQPLGLRVVLYPASRDTLPALLRIPFVYPLGNTR